jgi:hypothetical protein
MNSVRLGIIGLGNMGSGHAENGRLVFENDARVALKKNVPRKHGLVADDLAKSFNR